MEKLINYMLKQDKNGLYIDVVNEAGDRIKDYNSFCDDQVIEYIKKSNVNTFFQGWNSTSEQFYLKNHPFLIKHLLKYKKIIDEDYEEIRYINKDCLLTLYLEELNSEIGYLNSEISYATSLRLACTNERPIPIRENLIFAENTFYKISSNKHKNIDLDSFNSKIPKNDLEKFITIAINHFENLEIKCNKYNVINSKSDYEIPIIPQIIIEKITEDKELYIKFNAFIGTMEYDFLNENIIKKIALINDKERNISITSLDLTKVDRSLSSLIKIFQKLQKDSDKKNSFYVDKKNRIILCRSIAENFVKNELFKLTEKFNILGTEKLKDYGIVEVKPKLTGNFSYALNYLEGQAELEIEGEKFKVQDIISKYKKNSYVVLSDGRNAVINSKYMYKLEKIFQDNVNDKVKISFFDLPIVEDILENKMYIKDFEIKKSFFYGINNLYNYKIDLPKLNATLREYQIYGYKWLSYLIDNNLGGCLADDMGLGKTLQAIAILTRLHSTKNKRSLVVMPKSLICNWENEIKNFSPGLKTYVYYGNYRDIKVFKKNATVLTTYGTLRNDIETLKDIKFDAVILDESQNIKNINSKKTKAALLLDATHRIALSGTPLENNLFELYSLFRFLNPSMFMSLEDFNRSYATPIVKEKNQEALEELRKKVYPFILRRVKNEVLKDLPDKIEKIVYIEMSESHKKFYEERRKYYYNVINDNLSKNGIGKVQFFILQALNELRQITSCPEVKNPGIVCSKKDLLLENISEAIANNHKVLVFTNYLGSINTIEKALKNERIEYLVMTGNTKNRQNLVDQFQNENKYKVFLMSIKTGGIGLNLTAADTIFIYDPWWNKTVENQAIDRAYRIGQDNTVFSYKLIMKDTIEEKMLTLQKLKSELLDNIISEDNFSAKSFTEKDIEFILGS